MSYVHKFAQQPWIVGYMKVYMPKDSLSELGSLEKLKE
jgi:hypothetical protein